MKKILCVLLALCMIAALAACGDSKTKTTEPTKAPAAAGTKDPAPAKKDKMSAEEIAAALDKAETAEDFNKLIEKLEGAYGEDEPITLGGDSITLAQIREMAALFASIGGDGPGGDEPGGEAPKPVSGDAAKAVGEWTGVYCKFVGDENGVTDDPFSLILNADGTAVSHRGDMDYSATWSMDGADVTMTEKFMGMTIDYTGTLTDGVLHLFNGDPKDLPTK